MTPPTAPEKPEKDDLDAFFEAAASNNPRAVRMAAKKVRQPAPAAQFVPAADAALAEDGPEKPPGPGREPSAAAGAGADADGLPAQAASGPVVYAEQNAEAEEQFLHEIIANQFAADSGDNLDGKFIAVDPRTLPDYHGHPDAPFVLIPAGIHRFLPWWGWLVIAGGFFLVISGVVILPVLHLNRLTSRLGVVNEAEAQQVMRQLVINADDRTVTKLYEVAASPKSPMAARLRAVDAMSLIRQSAEVDRVLLRLELSGETDERIREAAIAARRQRVAARTRGEW